MHFGECFYASCQNHGQALSFLSCSALSISTVSVLSATFRQRRLISAIPLGSEGLNEDPEAASEELDSNLFEHEQEDPYLDNSLPTESLSQNASADSRRDNSIQNVNNETIHMVMKETQKIQ